MTEVEFPISRPLFWTRILDMGQNASFLQRCLKVLKAGALGTFIVCLSFVTFAQDKNQDKNVVMDKLQIPWEIQFLPNSSILLFTERTGFLNIVDTSLPENGRTRIQIDKVAAIGEGGLLGLAVHPKYPQKQWIYLYRTTKKGDQYINQVLRYTLKDNVLSEEKIMIDNIPGNEVHNGGRIKFGPDGYLYITTGDANQPQLAQDKTSLAGKILRIDENGSTPGNVFNNAVYSYGHRNPEGLAFDKQKRLWATEHGPAGFDKVNLIKAGKNYGWPIVQNLEYPKELTAPILSSGADETWAPAGLSYWDGKLYFGGLRGESLYEVVESNEDEKVNYSVKKLFSKKWGRIRAVTVGPDNVLYISTSNQDGRASQVHPQDDIILKIEASELSS